MYKKAKKIHVNGVDIFIAPSSRVYELFENGNAKAAKEMVLDCLKVEKGLAGKSSLDIVKSLEK